MKCARLQLQDRFKAKVKPDRHVCPAVDNPRRYCQKRMINPEHEEDPRWTDVYQRYHCNAESQNTLESARGNPDPSDLFLTVQTLQFQGDVDQTKKCRTSFKYKIPTDGAKHRMFVKQAVDNEYSDDGRSSQLTCYYFDDYVKYLFNNDKSRPNSGKSSLFLQGLSNIKENKATQVDSEKMAGGNNISQKHDYKLKRFLKKNQNEIADKKSDDGDVEGTKITFSKSGKRQSLTISRTQSPETVHVIRVDVVCNRGSSTHSEYEEKKTDCLSSVDIENIKTKRSHFSDKYLLTNTIKKLDESLSGAKVTLLCKTFKLTARAKTSSTDKPKTNTDETLIPKESKKNPKHKSIKTKVRKQIYFS